MNQRRVGALLSYVSIFISTIIGLLLTPFLIRFLGDSQYGVYILVGSFSSYLIIINSALSDTTIRYLIKYEADKDIDGQKNVMGYMFYINLILAAIVIFCGIFIWFKIPVFFGETFDYTEIILARRMLILLLVELSANIVFNVFHGALVAKQRFVFLKTLEIISLSLSTIMIVAILLLGYKALALVIVTTITNISIIGIKIGYYLKKFRIGINFKPSISKTQLLEIVKYVLPLVGIIIADQIFWKLDNIIIGLISGATLITVYSIGMSFHKYFMRFSTVISKVMVPKTMITIDMGATPREITDMLIRVSRIQAIILMLVMSGLIMFGKEFIQLWVGHQYTVAYYIMICTLIPYSLELIGNLRNIVMQSKGIYWKKMIVMIVISLLNVILTIILLKLVGIVGAALATGLGILVNFIITTYILQKDVGIETNRYFKELVSGILPVSLLMIPIGLLLNISNKSSWTILSIRIITYTAGYTLLMWKIGINQYEKDLISNLYRRKPPIMNFESKDE